MTRWLIIGLVRLLTGTRVHWKGTEPSEHQRIYFANHTSNLDAIVIWSAFLGISIPSCLKSLGSELNRLSS